MVTFFSRLVSLMMAWNAMVYISKKKKKKWNAMVYHIEWKTLVLIAIADTAR